MTVRIEILFAVYVKNKADSPIFYVICKLLRGTDSRRGRLLPNAALQCVWDSRSSWTDCTCIQSTHCRTEKHILSVLSHQFLNCANNSTLQMSADTKTPSLFPLALLPYLICADVLYR